MEKHKCKLCSRTFTNGRALGGHMKAHLIPTTSSSLPLPLPVHHHHLLGGDSVESSSYSSSGEEEEEREEMKAYGLRENPKRSFRMVDPEFSLAGGASVVQDRESETETESRNPTRRRSKRIRKSGSEENQSQNQISHVKNESELKNPSWVAAVESPEPVSSVSDTSSDEDVAMCLMMLSRDVWNTRKNQEDVKPRRETTSVKISEETKVVKIGGKFQCEKCGKSLRSSQALGGHRRICSSLNSTEKHQQIIRRKVHGNVGVKARIFECPYCSKVFGSGQALGGHKRSHLIVSSSSSTTVVNVAAANGGGDDDENSGKFVNSSIDLNLPAPMEDDEFSVVSDA